MFEIKKLKWVAYLGIVLISVAMWTLPVASKDVGECYNEHYNCRARALQGGYGVIQTTIYLTACDVGLIGCIVLAMID